MITNPFETHWWSQSCTNYIQCILKNDYLSFDLLWFPTMKLHNDCETLCSLNCTIISDYIQCLLFVSSFHSYLMNYMRNDISINFMVVGDFDEEDYHKLSAQQNFVV